MSPLRPRDRASRSDRPAFHRADGGAELIGIRRLDWRFLLPLASGERRTELALVGASDPIRALAAGVGLVPHPGAPADPGQWTGRARGPEGYASEGFAELPRQAAGSGASVDEAHPLRLLGVLATGDSTGPEVAAGRLPAADVVWWEVDRLAPGGLSRTPGRLLRELTAAGFGSAVVYWAKGGHDRCTMYLPLSGGLAIRWFFGSALRAPGPVRWTLSIATRLLAVLGSRTIAALVPAYAVMAWRRSEGGPTPAMVAVADRAGAIGPVAESAALLYGEGDWSRVVHVPFAPGSTSPAAAVKHPRTPRFNEETARERATLLDLRERLGEMRDGLPRPIASYEKDGLRVVVEDWVDGHPMFGGRRGHARGRAARRNLRFAAEWLRRLHERTAENPAPLGDLIPSLVDAPREAYLERVGDTAAERDLLDRFRAAADALGHLRLPRVMEHRDYGPWNIYHTSAGIVVIDWEVAERGFPLCDLLYFGMHWRWITGRVSDRGDQARSLRHLLSPASRDELGNAVRLEVDRHLSATGLDPALVPLMLVHLLLRQAVDVVTRREGEGEGAGRHDRDNRYAEYLRALAPHAAELFPSRSAGAGRGA